MTIRRVLPADAENLAAIERECSVRPWSTASIQQQVSKPGTAAWTVLADHDHVGHLLTQQVLDEAEILTIAVLPQQRRRGHASSLMSAAIEHWRATGVHRAYLEVRVGNSGAIHLYERFGWTPTGRRMAYYSDGSDALCMSLVVGEPC